MNISRPRRSSVVEQEIIVDRLIKISS